MIMTLCNGDLSKYDFVKNNFHSLDYKEKVCNVKFSNYVDWKAQEK